MSELFDFICIGGGAAGLSLAYRLSRQLQGSPSILIVERENKDRDERNWCFWSCRPTPLDFPVHCSWKSLRVASGSAERIIPLGDYRYSLIRGIDFHASIRRELETRGNVRWIHASASGVGDGPQDAEVFTDAGTFRGKWVFDSRCRSEESGGERGSAHRFFQRFCGWKLETAQPCFDPGIATFMDFRIPQGGDVRFCYLLPFSETSALVELVSLQPCDSKALMEGYLKKILHIPRFRILSREAGASPLAERPLPRRLGRRVLSIGIPGGMIKPTTGYAFLRIQKDSKSILESLQSRGHPFHIPPSPRGFRLCDSMLLEIQARHPERMADLYARLFAANSIRRIFRFLDEEATPAECLRIMNSMPRGLFLKAWMHIVFGRRLQEARAGSTFRLRR
jgi:lycopene beta-cyclase